MKLVLAELLTKTYNTLNKKNKEYIHNQKYKIVDYFNEILNFSRNSIYWCRYNGMIKGKTLNNKHNEFVRMGVYNESFLILLEQYYKKQKYLKLKYQSVDVLFVKNK